MCDMFLIWQTISFTGYSDDDTPFVVRDNTTNVVKALQEISENLIKWFSDKQMKLNTDKWHVLLNGQRPKTTKIGNLCLNNSSCKKLLGINFASKLKFTNYTEKICQKAPQKLNVIARLASYMGISKRCTLMNAFLSHSLIIAH